MLEWAGSVGEICLKYLDESGFNLWANVTYSWSKRGEQKRIEQTKKRGKRLNICGLLEIGKGFEYGLALKSFKSDSYIKLMDWQADQAEKRFSESGQITVIVADQGTTHVSRATREQYKRWEKQGLYIFLLPTYSPELNRIENEWQRIKEDELAGRMFEDEYELAMAVISAIESRNERSGLEVARFLFKNQTH
jgi:putative transposase